MFVQPAARSWAISVEVAIRSIWGTVWAFTEMYTNVSSVEKYSGDTRSGKEIKAGNREEGRARKGSPRFRYSGRSGVTFEGS